MDGPPIRFLHRRRALLAALPMLGITGGVSAEDAPDERYAAVRPDYRMTFPLDHGSHPQYRIEWWYATGWLTREAQADCGFQITFFRIRPQLKPGNPSRFNPEHVLIAHAAIADMRRGRLVHAQRAARQGFGLAGSAPGNTRVWIDDWQLLRDGGVYRCHAAAPELALSLTLAPTQAVLLQGKDGYSRKGPRPESASHYYSLPQLAVAGSLRVEDDRPHKVNGRAWLDHEWSSSYLDPDAAGWDWIGINLADGGAVMAFRMRDRNGGVLWADGTYRDAHGATRGLGRNVRFTPLRRWRSPRTGAEYPVAFEVRAGNLQFRIEPMMEDQENDTRATTGAVYWEGAVVARHDGKVIGRGYLELTGYLQALQI